MVTGKNNDPTAINQQDGFTRSQSGRCHLALSCIDQELSFCITDLYNKKHLQYGHFKINEWRTDFEPIFRKEFGKTSFKKATAMVWSPRNTLIPEGVYLEEGKQNYFHFEFGDVKKIDIKSDLVEGIQAYNVYGVDQKLEDILSETIPNIRLKHHQSTLLELLSRLNKLSNKSKAYVHVQASHFDLVIFDKNKLTFANIFEYQSPEDFIYFLLLAFEELGLQFREIPLIFLGKFNEDDDLYQLIKKYTDEIEWIAETKYYNAVNAVRDDMDHENFLLFNQVVCVS